jgi:hypothetical protein
MKVTLRLFITICSLIAFTSCTSNFGTDDFIPESEIEILTGSANDVSEIYADSLYSHPYSLDDLSRDNNVLNIDVTYSGGEGGCPTHLFVLNWDGNIHNGQADSLSVELGLAHFLPTVDNCEALVDERLSIDLSEVLGDQLQDSLSFTVINLVDSTQITLNP